MENAVRDKEMRKIKKFIFEITVASYIAYLFFIQLIDNVRASFLLFGIVSVLFLLNKREIFISNRYKMIIVLLLLNSIIPLTGILFAKFTWTAFTIFVPLFLCTLITIYFAFTNYSDRGYLYIFVFGFIHMGIVLYSFINKENFIMFAYEHLNRYIDIIKGIDYYYSRGRYVGIASNTAETAFYISMVIIVLTTGIFFGRRGICRKAIKIFLLFVAGFSLYLTGRRGNVLALGIAISLIVIISHIKEKKILRLIAITTISSILIVCIIYKLELYQYIFKFVFREGGDFTTNRDNISAIAIQDYINNFGIGYGRGTFSQIHGISVHNTYLELLCETSILGLIVFCAMLFYNLKNSFSVFFKEKNEVVAGAILFQIYFIVMNFFESELLRGYSIGLYLYFVSFIYKRLHQMEYGEKNERNDKKIDNISQR